MHYSPHQLAYFEHKLTLRAATDSMDRMAGALLDAQVDLSPHQIDAALFATSNPLSKGVILADEVGLGKTIEAGLLIAQRWAERKRHILVIVPANLRKQWHQELADKFGLSATILEAKSFRQSVKDGVANPFDAASTIGARSDRIVICSYQFAAGKADAVKSVPWDLVVVDEAHRLRNVYKPDNKTARTLLDALAHARKVLLTATPLQNSLLELYGLVSFIDDRVFGDLDSFRQQFGPNGQGKRDAGIPDKDKLLDRMNATELAANQFRMTQTRDKLARERVGNQAQATIEPVPKGEFGGDALQRVVSQGGQPCGTILWESKRTRNWSDGWLTKLREDQRAAKAEVAVLVSQALPKGVEAFDVVDGVWVTSPRAALPVATVLRHTLLQVSMARAVSEGQQTKTEMVYQYLTGPRFRHRVEAIVEAFSSMQEDLDKERKAIMKQWAKREEQIERVMGATVGMYGDLQGIAGKSLQEIEGLELSALSFDSETPPQ